MNAGRDIARNDVNDNHDVAPNDASDADKGDYSVAETPKTTTGVN